MLQDKIKNQILISLMESINPYKVVLFGSFAYGRPEEQSDIDLLVVINSDDMPANYEENMRNYLSVSSALRDIKKRIPIDLIVHTKPMHQKFIELGSMFSREILEKGEVLYEKDK